MSKTTEIYINSKNQYDCKEIIHQLNLGQSFWVMKSLIKPRPLPIKDVEFYTNWRASDLQCDVIADHGLEDDKVLVTFVNRENPYAKFAFTKHINSKEKTVYVDELIPIKQEKGEINFSNYADPAPKPVVVKNKLNIRKFCRVVLIDGEKGQVIKYSSLKSILVKLDKGEERLVTNLEIKETEN